MIAYELSLVLFKELTQDRFPPFLVLIVDIYNGLVFDTLYTPRILFVLGKLIMLAIPGFQIFEIQRELEAIVSHLRLVALPIDHGKPPVNSPFIGDTVVVANITRNIHMDTCKVLVELLLISLCNVA